MKPFKLFAMPLLALALTGLLSACSEKKTDEENGEGGGGAFSGAVLTPEETKNRLSQIGQDFLNAIPASDFNELDQLANYIKTTYCSSYDQTEVVDQWANDCFQALIDQVLPPEQGDYRTYNYTIRTYRLSQFRAHLNYDEGTGRWEVQAGTPDLQATCKDQNGQPVVARLVTSGRTKRVYAGDFEMDKDYIYMDGSYTKVIYDYDHAYFEIPETITIRLTRGNELLVNVEVTTDLNSVSGDNFDLSKDAASVTVKAQLAGYDIQCQRAAAQANKSDGAQVNFFIVKNGRMLLSAEVVATLGLPAGLVWKEGVDDDDFAEQLQNFSGQVTLCKVDILGQLQVQGICTDLKKVHDAFVRADDNKRSSDIVNGCAQEANSAFKTWFTYDNNGTIQGNMELEATPNSSGEKYYLEPVVVFPDGSRYNMTNESYFNEDNFGAFVKLYEDLFDRYEQMIEKYEDDGPDAK